MKTRNENKFKFPVGYHSFHKKQVYNYHLNRWHSIGFARFEDMQEAGKMITSFKEWKRVMINLADKALEEERYLNAAIYYRSAEFYIVKKCAEKEELYDKFSELFYEVVKNDPFERHKVPYNGSFLPAIHDSRPFSFSIDFSDILLVKFLKYLKKNKCIAFKTVP